MSDEQPIHDTPSLCTGLFASQNRVARRLALLGIFAPIAAFYAICTRYLLPYPIGDDYAAILVFLDNFAHLPTRSAKLAEVLFAQHTQYKLIYMHAIVALQFAATGHPSFILLSVLGNLHVLLLGYLLWRCFLPLQIEPVCRLALFVPVSLLLFQLNYAETLNWAVAAPQYIGVAVFALLCLWAAAQPARWAFPLACAAYVLAVAASANGFALLPVGLLLFLQQRKPWRIAVWLVLTLLCAAVYFHHYTLLPADPAAPHAFRPAYILSFILSLIGASAGIQVAGIRFCSAVFGLAICAICALAVQRRYFRLNPAIFYFGLFLLLTCIGVSLARNNLGYNQSLSGRYKIYSDLLVVCCYCFAAHRLAALSLPRRRQALKALLCACFVFFLIGDAFGIRAMHKRYVEISAGMALYRSSGGAKGPLVTAPDPDLILGLNKLLKQMDHDNIYRVP